MTSLYTSWAWVTQSKTARGVRKPGSWKTRGQTLFFQDPLATMDAEGRCDRCWTSLDAPPSTGQTPGAAPLHHHFLQHQEVPSPGLTPLDWLSGRVSPGEQLFHCCSQLPRPPRVPDFCTDCLVLLTHSKKFLWWRLQVPAHVGCSLGTYLCSFHFSMI